MQKSNESFILKLILLYYISAEIHLPNFLGITYFPIINLFLFFRYRLS